MTNYIDVPKEEVLKHITQSLIDEMNKQLDDLINNNIDKALLAPWIAGTQSNV